MQREQLDEAMNKSVAILEATASIAKAQAILIRAGLKDFDEMLANVRAEMDAEYDHLEPTLRRWREVT